MNIFQVFIVIIILYEKGKENLTMEKEFVGICGVCEKNVYCHNGFLEGVVQEDRTLVCFSCQRKINETDTL